MPTILFVHGTGVRKAAYDQSMQLLRLRAGTYLPSWQLEGCCWGDAFGARLNQSGDSVPDYNKSGDAMPALALADEARWRLLSEDALLELRLVPEDEFIGDVPGEILWQRVQALPGERTIPKLLDETRLTEVWLEFIPTLTTNDEWKSVVSAATEAVPIIAEKAARAITASFQNYVRVHNFPGLTGMDRDRLKWTLTVAFGGEGLGVVQDWLLHRLANAASRNRGKLTDTTSAAVGDTLRYQARGQTIRNFIAHEANKYSATAILAHSLGGIAAVDWLASAPTRITHLITAGSQAPYFYEIDALYSRGFGQGLPDFFPSKWLNFFDPRDLLSYRAAKIFPGTAEDKLVDNGQPFPEAHSAYWNNDKVWEEIRTFVQ